MTSLEPRDRPGRWGLHVARPGRSLLAQRRCGPAQEPGSGPSVSFRLVLPSRRDTRGLLGSGDTLLLLLSWGRKPSHGEPPRGAGLQGVQAQHHHQGRQGQAGTAGASGSTQPVVPRSRFAPRRHQHSVDTGPRGASENTSPWQAWHQPRSRPCFSFTWRSPSVQASLMSEAAERT